ncbi:hypothetical protein [Lacihabitans soyangensis]|uniref:DUF3078 domain-containing protein n=1 Tax=Lacihabitans soyangensis TaxID=869394 RepID=A0AAE3KTN1_9BACT|nr:hypothetical protein [Lacihabitans soyangensis]MCP9763944.1 hypothetical protein [Lacihabitans soyangensis]
MKSVSISIFLIFSFYATFSQNTDSTQTPTFLRGQITATNNGVSLIPTFSLGKPAILFDMNVGKGRLSFDPMFRFGMTGKPWAFVFWWRYKLIQQKKFNLGLGAHPSVVFRDISVTENGTTRNFLAAQRFFAWEVSPTYLVSKNASLGLYYLGSKGLTKDVLQHTTFVALRSILNLKLSNKFSLGFIPQAYYLKMDDNDGTYINATLNLFKRNFPVSLNAIASKAIKTDIAGKDFLWSIGLVYNINNQYSKLK